VDRIPHLRTRPVHSALAYRVTRNLLTFANTTAIAYRKDLEAPGNFSPICSSSCVRKRQKITSIYPLIEPELFHPLIVPYGGYRMMMCRYIYCGSLSNHTISLVTRPSLPHSPSFCVPCVPACAKWGILSPGKRHGGKSGLLTQSAGLQLDNSHTFVSRSLGRVER